MSLEADHVLFVNEDNVQVAVGPNCSEGWDSRKERAISKLSRRKAALTRHLNIAESLLKSWGSRRKLHELTGKIEEALTELEQAGEHYEAFLDGEGLQEHLDYIELASERANCCIENIEIALNERENNPSGVGSVYAPTIHFEMSSSHSSSSQGKEDWEALRCPLYLHDYPCAAYRNCTLTRHWLLPYGYEKDDGKDGQPISGPLTGLILK